MIALTLPTIPDCSELSIQQHAYALSRLLKRFERFYELDLNSYMVPQTHMGQQEILSQYVIWVGECDELVLASSQIHRTLALREAVIKFSVRVEAIVKTMNAERVFAAHIIERFRLIYGQVTIPIHVLDRMETSLIWKALPVENFVAWLDEYLVGSTDHKLDDMRAAVVELDFRLTLSPTVAVEA